jgi:uncharacterized protein (TIGR00255 family)
MTGFARVRKSADGIDISVTLKGVNHRGLDLNFHMGSEFDPFEPDIRALVKNAAARGHIDIRISASREGSDGAFRIDHIRLAQYMEAYREAAEKYGLSITPDLNSVIRVPGILTESGETDFPPGFGPALLECTTQALELFNEFREREGAELVAVMKERCASIQSCAQQMEAIRDRAVPAFQKRLRERLDELLGGSNIEPQRLAQEAALLADRSDIGEEISRLQIHTRQLDQLLGSSGEIGKKLDFLLQEMNRETNTILSKTSGIGETGLGISDMALLVKADVEKIREQALNLE